MAFVNFRAGLTVVRPPANWTVSWANTNFSGFTLAPQRVSQLAASVNAWAMSSDQMRVSSTHLVLLVMPSVKSGRVSITWRFGGCQVAVSSPRRDEGRKMSIIWVEWNGTRSMHLLHHLGYAAGLMVGRLCVVRLVSIEGLEVHNSSWFSVSLPYDHHTVAPCVRRAFSRIPRRTSHSKTFYQWTGTAALWWASLSGRYSAVEVGLPSWEEVGGYRCWMWISPAGAVPRQHILHILAPPIDYLRYY